MYSGIADNGFDSWMLTMIVPFAIWDCLTGLIIGGYKLRPKVAALVPRA